MFLLSWKVVHEQRHYFHYHTGILGSENGADRTQKPSLNPDKGYYLLKSNIFLMVFHVHGSPE